MTLNELCPAVLLQQKQDMNTTLQEVLTAELAKKQSHTADTSSTSYSESLDLAKARRWRQRPASAFVPSNAQRCVIDRKPATARGNPRGEEKLEEARADPKEELNKEIAELRRRLSWLLASMRT